MRTLLTLALATVLTTTALAQEPQPGTLAAELEKISAGFAKRAPEALRKTFAQGIADVRATGILEKALNVGDKAPNATLLSSSGKVQLSSLWAEQPIVLTFYRGGWCPYCNASLQALQKELAKFDGVGAKLVAVAPELPAKVDETVAKNNLTMTVLSDKGNQLAGKLGIAFKLPEVILPTYRDRLKLATFNGDENYTLPLAATYVIDTTGTIRWAFLDADYKKRAEPADVIKAVRKITGAAPGGLGGPEPAIPHQQLAREVGTWDAQMTMWTAPGAVPLTTEAVETNTMLGPFWLVSEFKCDSPELPFSGRMQLGYDPQKKTFVGTWVDTMSPYIGQMTGDYDIATRSLTMVSHGTDARTGEPSTATMTTRYVDENTKVFTMHEGDAGSAGFKMMEIRYTRRQ